MKPRDELHLISRLKEERSASDKAYAPIIVKTIVYSFVALICVAFVGFLTKLIW